MGLSVNAGSLLLVKAISKNSFAEELLFRNFLTNRLIQIAGFVKGNILQATIFGIIHTLLFAFATTNLLFLAQTYLHPPESQNKTFESWLF